MRSVLNRFTNNKGGRGGIYYADIGSELLVLSENATNNQADFGSILYFRGDKIKVSNSYYYQNKVKYSGGVFYISRESKNNIQFSENNFIQNTAQEAGGVFFCDKTGEGNPSCQCTNCVFNQNKASSLINTLQILRG